jgi:hypothetical protein
MKLLNLLKGIPLLGNRSTFLGMFLVFGIFGGSVFLGGSTLAGFLNTTLQVDTESTFRRLVALNPLMVKTVSSLEEMAESIKDTAKTYTGMGEGEDGSGTKESVTTDKILSLLGLSSFSPISNVASAFSGLSSGENNFRE